MTVNADRYPLQVLSDDDQRNAIAAVTAASVGEDDPAILDGFLVSLTAAEAKGALAVLALWFDQVLVDVVLPTIGADRSALGEFFSGLVAEVEAASTEDDLPER